MLLVFIALPAAAGAGAIGLLVIGPEAGAAGVAFPVLVALAGLSRAGPRRSGALAVCGGILAASLVFGGYYAWQIGAIVTETSAAADAADAEQLKLARSKTGASARHTEFRLDLTAEELTAVAQNALARATDNPIRRVEFTVVDGEDGAAGQLGFEVQFKGSSATGNGAMNLSVDDGRIGLEIVEVSFDMLTVPAVAHGAVEDLMRAVLSLNRSLDRLGVELHTVELEDGRILLLGERAGSRA